MGLFEKIKCYTTSALVFWLIYHIFTTCPLCCPLPYAGTENEDAICKYAHTGYAYVKPYADPAIEYYKASPIKPYVDNSIATINEVVIEPYGPIVKEQFDTIYELASTKIAALKARLDDDSLSNERIAKIVIPAEEELEAFIGTPNAEQEKTVEPVTPADDEVEPTSVPTTEETNVVPETEVAEPTEEAVAEPEEEVVLVPEETEAPVAEEESNGKLEEIIEEVKIDVEQVAAEIAIEAAEAVGEAL